MMLPKPARLAFVLQKTYSVSLETILSSHLYKISMSSKTDIAADSGKHITLHFSAEVIL